MMKRFSLALLIISIISAFLISCESNTDYKDLISNDSCSSNDIVSSSTEKFETIFEIDFPTTAVAYPLNEEELHELTWKRSFLYNQENVLAYNTADDKTILRIYSAPVEEHMNKLIFDSSNNYYYCDSFFEKSLPSTWSQSTPIIIGDKDYGVKISPTDSNSHGAKISTNINVLGQKKEVVSYFDAFGSGIDLYCYATSFGVNFEIVFNELPLSNTIQILVSTPNLLPEFSALDYLLFKKNLNDTIPTAIVETPLLVDSIGNWNYSNSIKLIEKDKNTCTYLLEYALDEEFLKNESTVFPVRTTHSINLYRSKQPDTSIYDKTEEVYSHYLSPFFLLGYSDLKGEGQTYIRYEALNYLNIQTDKVISAKYVFCNVFPLKDEVKINAYAVTDDWCSRNVRWHNKPTNDNVPLSTTMVKERGDYYLDITSLFKKMIVNRDSKSKEKYSVRNSFMIKCDATDSCLIIPSGDSGGLSPYLEVIIEN